MDFTPEERQQIILSCVETLREDIRKGKAEALWEYIDYQWPKAVFDDFQRDIIESVMLGGIKEVAIKGCTSPGKGFAVSVAINCWFDVFPESKVVITSSNIEHAEKVMFGEVTHVRQKMQYAKPCKVMTTQFQDNPKHYLVVVNPASGEAFSGQHGPATLFCFDEASAVPDMLYENARQQARVIIALSNPRTLSGWFRDLFRPAADPDVTQTVITSAGPRRLFTVGGMDCRNVREKRLKEPFGPLGGIDIDGVKFNQGERIPDEAFAKVKAVIPNQMDYARYAETMASTDEFRRRVFGEGKFPREDAEAQLFLQSWFERHYQAYEEAAKEGNPPPVEAFGLDLAASADGDSTILTAGGTKGIRQQHAFQRLNTQETLGLVVTCIRENYGIELTDGRVPIAVDAGGIGKSLADSMEEMGCYVIRCINNARAETDPDRYANRRAELYGEFARRLSPLECPNDPFMLPRDPKLEQELCVHRKIVLARGFRLQPKDKFPGQRVEGHTVREDLGRSPDRSDSACLLYAACGVLESGGVATLKRPLILLTQADEAALVKPETDKSDEEIEREQIEKNRARQASEIAELLGWEPDESGEAEVPFPSFL